MKIILAAQSAVVPPPPQDIFLHPFHKFSPFRRPIGTGAVYAGDGHATTLAWNAKNFNELAVDNGHGFNVYRNTPSDSLRTIKWYGGGGGAHLPITVWAPLMRNPTLGGTQGDSPVILYDTVEGQDRFLEFSRFRGHPEWSARDCNIIDPYGDGLDAGASATDIAGMGIGLFSWELAPSWGPICKAIGITLNAKTSPAQLANRFIWPAKHVDSSCGGGYACNGPIAYGQLFALPSSINLDSLGLTPLGLRLAAMCRDYGVYAVDNGGQNFRGDQAISSSVRSEVIAQMRIIKPRMRAILNNESTQSQPTCSGGGNPIAPNGAYDSGSQ